MHFHLFFLFLFKSHCHAIIQNFQKLFPLYKHLFIQRLHHFKFIYNLILIPFSTMNVCVISICCLEGHGGTKERSQRSSEDQNVASAQQGRDDHTLQNSVYQLGSVYSFHQYDQMIHFLFSRQWIWKMKYEFYVRHLLRSPRIVLTF